MYKPRGNGSKSDSAELNERQKEDQMKNLIYNRNRIPNSSAERTDRFSR